MPMSRTSSVNRHLFIAASIVVLHAAALWALQSGLLRPAAEVIVPAQILSEFIAPPAPKAAPTPPAAVVKSAPAPTPAPHPPAPQLQPLNQPPPALTANAPLVAATPQVAAAPAMAATPAAAAATAAPAPAPAKVELPSSDAQYLQNPKLPYPTMSKRLGEQGKVVLRVLIGVDGTAQKAEIQQSSGFDRLDQAALNTVLRWRYVPGKLGGVAEAMWFNIPINFVLE